MAAATLRPQMTAATEHGQEVLRLQSTAMSANVVFINIDWKASRHNKTLETNMMLLGWTIARVVRNMKPAMVCMCEVGEASIPLTKEQMQQVADQSMQAWRDAATEPCAEKAPLREVRAEWWHPQRMLCGCLRSR